MAERTRETILVVDDERGPRESLRMILSPSFRVLAAANASTRSRSCAASASTS
jgi:PleD family two-component response regulator